MRFPNLSLLEGLVFLMLYLVDKFSQRTNNLVDVTADAPLFVREHFAKDISVVVKIDILSESRDSVHLRR